MFSAPSIMLLSSECCTSRRAGRQAEAGPDYRTRVEGRRDGGAQGGPRRSPQGAEGLAQGLIRQSRLAAQGLAQGLIRRFRLAVLLPVPYWHCCDSRRASPSVEAYCVSGVTTNRCENKRDFLKVYSTVSRVYGLRAYGLPDLGTNLSSAMFHV